MTASKLLILGGSGEAADLARALAGDARYDVTLSLAGRTRSPCRFRGSCAREASAAPRVWRAFSPRMRFDLLIDATHPFAVQMKANAIEAAQSQA